VRIQQFDTVDGQCDKRTFAARTFAAERDDWLRPYRESDVAFFDRAMSKFARCSRLVIDEAGQ